MFDEISSITSFESRVITFGCGCGKKTITGEAISTSRRVTVYEVQVNNSSVGEFESLPQARAEAVKLGGRVRVTSKVVTS